MPARRSPGDGIARRRLIAARYVRSDAPRIRVRLPRDPIMPASPLAFALGFALILVSPQTTRALSPTRPQADLPFAETEATPTEAGVPSLSSVAGSLPLADQRRW
jgi:hypothetical protein